jgi:hypothetical protein
MLAWFKTRNSHGRSAQTRIAKPFRLVAVQLRLEALEDRWVPSPITHVQDIGTANSASSAATLTITASAPVAQGDTILLALGGSTTSATIGVADTKGNTYHQDLLFLAGNPTSIYSAPVTTALVPGDQITVTFTGGTPPIFSIATAVEFAGLVAGALDQTHTDNGLNTSPNSGPTATTTQPKEVLFGVIATGANSSNATPPTINFTPGMNYIALTSAQNSAVLPGPSGATFRLDPEFRLVSATGQYVADGTLMLAGSVSSFSWGAGIATYKAADTTAHFSVTASTANPAFGIPFSVTVTAQDLSNATATGYTGTVHLTSSDPLASLPADFTFTAADQGTHTFTNVILKTAGAQTITATDTNPAAGFTASVTVNVASSTPNQRFITNVYMDLLGRPVDPAGLAKWTQQLDAGTDRVTVVLRIETSQEYLVDQVTKAYMLLLKRAPDPTGLNCFLIDLQNGGTIEQMMADIAGSPEYFTKRAMGNNNTWLQTVYQDLLGRPIDPTGQMFFSQQLANGATRGQVALGILTSMEYRQNLVTTAYHAFLRRDPDPTGLANWVIFLTQGGTDQQLNAGILGSAEYFARP